MMRQFSHNEATITYFVEHFRNNLMIMLYFIHYTNTKTFQSFFDFFSKFFSFFSKLHSHKNIFVILLIFLKLFNTG